MSKAIEDVIAERERQQKLPPGTNPGTMSDFDKGNTQNDWIAYINAYIGRAAAKCFRNERENQLFRENMVKAGALVIAAIESYDAGNSQQ